jgi:hypothetical protein
MKKLILFLLFALITTNSNSEDKYYFDNFSYDQFSSWMKTVKIPEFNFYKMDKKGSKDVYNIEYSAVFTNNSYENFTARLGNPDVFYQYEDLKSFEKVGPYYLDGFTSVFVYSNKITKPSNITYLMVQMSGLQATFSITAMTKDRLTQSDMEKVFKCFHLSMIDLNKISNWSPEITIEMRLPGFPTEIVEEKPDEMAKKQFKVTFLKTGEFVKELSTFFKDKRGSLDITALKNINLVCITTTDFKTLENMKDGEKIEFRYYIK